MYDALHTYGSSQSKTKKWVYRCDLTRLNRKCEEFEEKSKNSAKYLKAYEVASTLYDTLKRNFYALEENKIDYAAFKANSLEAIKVATPVLSHHRGCKHILANIALGIAGLGLFYAVAGLVNLAVNGHFSFFSKTDSIKTLEKIEKDIDSYNQSANDLK